MQQGYSIDYVLDLPLPNFDALYASCRRVYAREMLDNGIQLRIVTQGDQKACKAEFKRWAEASQPPGSADDSERLIRSIRGA